MVADAGFHYLYLSYERTLRNDISSVSRVQHRTQALTIHQGAITKTMKTFIILLGLATFPSLFTVGQAKSIRAGE